MDDFDHSTLRFEVGARVTWELGRAEFEVIKVDPTVGGWLYLISNEENGSYWAFGDEIEAV